MSFSGVTFGASYFCVGAQGVAPGGNGARLAQCDLRAQLRVAIRVGLGRPRLHNGDETAGCGLDGAIRGAQATWRMCENDDNSALRGLSSCSRLILFQSARENDRSLFQGAEQQQRSARGPCCEPRENELIPPRVHGAPPGTPSVSTRARSIGIGRQWDRPGADLTSTHERKQTTANDSWPLRLETDSMPEVEPMCHALRCEIWQTVWCDVPRLTCQTLVTTASNRGETLTHARGHTELQPRSTARCPRWRAQGRWAQW